jgi:hypothetical protein
MLSVFGGSLIFEQEDRREFEERSENWYAYPASSIGVGKMETL